MWTRALAGALLLSLVANLRAAVPVELKDNGDTVQLSNGVVAFSVQKDNAIIRQMTLGDSPNLAGKGAYFAVVNSGGKDGWDVRNGTFKVVRNSPELVEVSVDAKVGHMGFDQHYVLRQGDPGFYAFVRMHHSPQDGPERNGQIRWSFYLDPKLFNYQLVTDKEQGPIPDLTGSTPVQDATYRLKDGSVYTKYDWCSYIEEDDVHGLCGSATTGSNYGAFIVNASKEFLQAPTKQEITVHAGPIMHRFLVSGHFEPRNLTEAPISGSWSKLCGPWMVYLTEGTTPKQIWSDAKARAKAEQGKWPYAWMDNADFPLERGGVLGTLTVGDNKRPAAGALIVLAAPQPDWQLQTLGYLFSARADADGKFDLKHVRPGTYTLYATVPGEAKQFRKDEVVVKAGDAVDLGNLSLATAKVSQTLFQIGTGTWKAVGFNLSDEPRQYGYVEKIPADLTFTVGKSDPTKDWYVAQAKPGDWTIAFDAAKPLAGEAILTLGIAGQTNNPKLQILVNGKPVGDYAGGNSSAAYRSAILGSSYHETKVIRFPASDLAAGSNAITLRLSGKGAVHYDMVKLQIGAAGTAK